MDDLIAELQKAEQEANQELWDKWLIFCWRHKGHWSVWYAQQRFMKDHPEIDMEKIKRTTKSNMKIQLFMATYYRKVSDMLFDGADDSKALNALQKIETNNHQYDAAKRSAERNEMRDATKVNKKEKINRLIHQENNAAYGRNWRTTK